jgi:hypothetical protein
MMRCKHCKKPIDFYDKNTAVIEYMLCPHCKTIMVLDTHYSGENVKAFNCNCRTTCIWSLIMDKKWYKWQDGDWKSDIYIKVLPIKKYHRFVFR